jgi:hypothetical protein
MVGKEYISDVLKTAQQAIMDQRNLIEAQRKMISGLEKEAELTAKIITAQEKLIAVLSKGK